LRSRWHEENGSCDARDGSLSFAAAKRSGRSDAKAEPSTVLGNAAHVRLDDLGPFLDFAGDKLAEIGGRTDKSLAT
jgi:hypothetical protein